MQVEPVMLAGAIEDLGKISSNLNAVLVTSVMSLVCTAFVLMTAVNSKRVGPTFMALIAAGAIWYGVMHMTVFRDEVGEDLNPKSAPPPAAVIVDVGHGPREER